ncbi:MAG TPA: hypothetical protein VFC76_04220 [Oscillospiraceae bacterium]|nr:hypothetical protein [Oscillospiraceae bacterium]
MKKIIACVVAVAMLLSLMPMAFAGDYVAKHTTESLNVIVEANKVGEQVIVKLKIPANSYLGAGDWEVFYDAEELKYNDADTKTQSKADKPEGFVTYNANTEGLIKIGIITDTREEDPATILAMVFDIIDDTVKNTTITIKTKIAEVCDADDVYGDDAYEVDVEDIEKIVVINDVEETEPEETEPEETEPEETEPEETEPALPDNVLEIIKQIEDFFNEYGLGFLLEVPEVRKAIENIARIIGGDMDLEDIIEELNKSLEGFKDILDEMGLPLPSIDEIIEFIMGLFGGGDNPSPNPSTTTTSSNGDVDDDDNNIDDNDENGDKQLGDAGIALAVSVCLTAAAAFVITKKKHDEE